MQERTNFLLLPSYKYPDCIFWTTLNPCGRDEDLSSLRFFWSRRKMTKKSHTQRSDDHCPWLKCLSFLLFKPNPFDFGEDLLMGPILWILWEADGSSMNWVTWDPFFDSQRGWWIIGVIELYMGPIDWFSEGMMYPWNRVSHGNILPFLEGMVDGWWTEH
jgi:hypothetical protein